jgi:hypothetical protein
MARGPMAGVSGPGKFSKRTDMKLPSAAYGEGVETAAIQSSAPLAKTADVKAAPASEVRAAAAGASVTPLYSPTERPDEPITTGVDIGPGAGSEVMGMGPQEDDVNFRATIRQYMPVLAYISSLPNTSPETRRTIRQLRDNL